jgi:hypothetical protein
MNAQIKDLLSQGNYIELVLNEEGNSIDVGDKLFFKLIQNIKNKGYGCFQKHYKEYVHRNMYYENNDKNQIKIHKKTLLKTLDIPSCSMKLFVCHKEKQPYHLFPSTTMLHSISYISKLTFKINNRVYLNFERRKYSNNADVSFNKIYINYNHDDNVDLTNIQTAIDTCVNLLTL